MPELPEVETITQGLQPLCNQKLLGVTIHRRNIVFPSKNHFTRILPRQKITSISRRGKYIIFELNRGYNLIFHLRLSGQLILSKKRRLKHDRMVILFKDTRLHFVEPRALGRAYLIESGAQPQELKGLFNLGPEPFEPRFTTRYLKETFNNRKARIKSLLLNQSIVAGLGNIYSDEALFLAKISPLRNANTLSDREITRLHQAVRVILKEAIKYLGTSVSDYKRPDGSLGRFQSLLNVYKREGFPCRICRGLIVRVKVGNRSWRYCPNCQR